MSTLNRIEEIFVALHPEAARVDVYINACSGERGGYTANVNGADDDGNEVDSEINTYTPDDIRYARPQEAIDALCAVLEQQLTDRCERLESVRGKAARRRG